MISYPFLNDFFKSVLTMSHGIGGRFHISKKSGLEINSDQLGEVITDLVKPLSGQKYPLDIMMPPVSTGCYTDKGGEWEKYRIVMFFLTTSYYNSNNQVKAPNPSTQTSTHTIPMDWHDMKRCAVNFLIAVAKVQVAKGLINNRFRLLNTDKVITPVSDIGIDRAAGVRLDFTCSVFNGCVLEDYTEAEIKNIIVPVDDSHAEHNL